MEKFTLGFVFSQDLSEVLLMQKNRPDWQAGRLNGVGGRIEPNEESIDCIVREVLEETGVQTQRDNWAYFGAIKGASWQVDLYAMLYFGNSGDFFSVTEEKVEWFKVGGLPDNVVEKLDWMVPMAIERLKNKEFRSSVVEYV